jgi:hypothetical protein
VGVLDIDSLQKYMNEFREQLEKGAIQEAYRGLMEYIMELKTYFKNKYPDYFVSGSIYFGYMDMTYFSVIPESLKQKKLKIAIVFNYETFCFEVWLSAVNKNVLTKYWNSIKDRNWDKYRVVKPGKGIDSILEYNLVNNPDFSNLDNLTKQIEKGTLDFIKDVEEFLLKHET